MEDGIRFCKYNLETLHWRIRAELLPEAPWFQIAEKAQYKPAFVYMPVVNHRSK